MRPYLLRSITCCAACACALLIALSPALATGLANAWEDDEGHIWVETDFYLLDVSHGSTCLVKLGSEPRDWAVLNVGEPVLGWHYDGTHEWSVWLGRGGGNESSINLYAGGDYLRTGGTVTQPSGTIAGVQFTGSLFVTDDPACTFPTTTVMRFHGDVPLIEIRYAIDNVASDPNPPAVNYAFTLLPGGDTGSDYLYWSGLLSEQPLPYGGRSGAVAPGLVPVTGADGHDYVYVTDYDKGAGQGLAYFARLDQTADFITDGNYGRLCYDDRTTKHQFSHLELYMDGTQQGTLCLYLYEPDPATPSGPVEAFIESYNGADTPLTAAFAASPLAGQVPLTVEFADCSLGAALLWAWDFGDGDASTERDPTHTYTAPGHYTVTLTVTDEAGSDTETRPDYISALPHPPVADFSAAPTAGTIPLVVQFADLSYQGDPDSWAWDFGDGTTSTEQSPSHTYAAPGRYTVSLVAANAGGESTRTRADFILASFADVPLDHWALDAILACVDASIVQGYGDSYHPDEPVTRAQMAVYIARALAGGDALVPSGPATPHFTDVGTDHWAYRYVEYARYEGVVQGYSGGLYAPDELVNRGQMAVYIARSVVSPPGDPNVPDPAPEDPPAFPDVTADNDWAWCYKHVQYIAGLEPPVVQGYSDGTYGPGVEVTRDQMAVYVARAFDLATTVLAGEAPLGRKVVALNGLRTTVEPAA